MKLKFPALAASVALALIYLPAAAHAAIVLSDDFAYANGPLTNVAPTKWFLHSGNGAGLFVTNGQIRLNSVTLTDDNNASFAGGPYTNSGSTAALYARMDVTILSTAELPRAAAGDYFAHFYPATFRGRLFATTNGAAMNTYRIALANGSSTPTTNYSSDLSVNTTYTIVCRILPINGIATVWVAPVNEQSPSVTAPDTAATGGIGGFAFRQASGTAFGTVYVDNFVVGTTFGDVLPGSSNPPFIVREPGDTNVAENTSITLSVLAGGNETLTYQWQYLGTNLPSATTASLSLPTIAQSQAGPYNVIVENAAGSVTSRVATVTVTGMAVGPSITNQPVSQSVVVGSSVTLSVGASGTAPISYRWQFFDTNLPGANTAFYTLNNVTTNQSGPYRCIVSNVVNAVTSMVATLTITPPSPTNIAYLHTLQDDVNYLPTNTTSLFTVEGIVTTYANLTPAGNLLFYIQDSTGGMAVFWGGADSSLLPPAGARVRVTAPLAGFNGLLELSPNAATATHSVTVISTGNPLPAAQAIPYASQNDPIVMEPLESAYFVASNVFVDLTAPTFVSGSTPLFTNAQGDTFTLFVNAQTDIVGQTKPTNGPVTIFGVLGQFDTSNPRSSGYQLIPTRFADILSTTKAPTVRFTNVLENLVRPGDLPTNTFNAHALRPTEKLTMRVFVSDPDGGTVSITPLSNNLPPSASWSYGATSGTSVPATFTFQPTVGNAGSNYAVSLRAANAGATNVTVWNIYVPTVAEQQVILSEFLANPVTATNAPHFNPLHRNPILTTGITTSDEYIELVNMSAENIELLGWSVADAVGVRHRFYDFLTLSSSNTVVVYGGPLNGDTPSIPGVYAAASESSAGLALNNTGSETIAVYNFNTNLITRIVYQGADLGVNSSLSRFPDLNGPFVPQEWISTNASSAGAQYTGASFSTPIPTPTGVDDVSVAVTNSVVTLHWPAVNNLFYTLWRGDKVQDKFRVVFGSQATNVTGQFKDTNAPGATYRFYFITTQP